MYLCNEDDIINVVNQYQITEVLSKANPSMTECNMLSNIDDPENVSKATALEYQKNQLNPIEDGI